MFIKQATTTILFIASLWVTILLLSLSSCFEKPVPNFGNPKVLWRKSLSESVTFGPISIGNSGVVATLSENKTTLHKFVLATGDIEWSSQPLEDIEYLDEKMIHLQQNQLVVAGFNFYYGFNFISGNPIWKIAIPKESNQKVTGDLMNSFFISEVKTLPNEASHQYIKQLDSPTGNSLREILPTYEGNAKKGVIFDFEYFSFQGKPFLAIHFGDLVNDRIYNQYLSFYDLNKKAWLYESIFLESSSYSNPALQVEADKVVLFLPSSIRCLSLITGLTTWSVKLPEGSLYTSGIANGKLLFSINKNMLCLGMTDGVKLWEQSIADFVGRVAELNGIGYFVGNTITGPSGFGINNYRLLALDLSNGNNLLQYSFEDRTLARQIATKTSPTQNLVVATGKELICYEAIR